jgi:hypothetical protein
MGYWPIKLNLYDFLSFIIFVIVVAVVKMVVKHETEISLEMQAYVRE